MKKLILAALVAGSAVWAAPARAAAPAGQDSKQTWEDYRIRTRKELDVIGDKIAKLEMSAKTAQADVRMHLDAQNKALRAKKSDADRMLNQFETAAAEARKELRVKLDRAMRDLKTSIHKAEIKSRERM
jgi:ribosome-associated translation inhibitor RaiA